MDDQQQLSAEQTEKAEQLIRELQEQNEKGEAYFEREKDALQAQETTSEADLAIIRTWGGGAESVQSIARAAREV